MNATFDFDTANPSLPAPERRQVVRIWAGVAISIAVHAALLVWYRQPAAPPAPKVSEPLTVRLRSAPVPTPIPEPVQAPPVPRADTPAVPTTAPAPRRQSAERPPRRVIAVDPATRQSAEETYPVETPSEPPPATAPDTPSSSPRFDLDAARQTARTVANEPDPAKKGTALERLPPPPLQTENKFERAIKSAKRRDCKDGVPGGLLAPLFLAMDKTDSGCKW
nr:hypothetical protein [uncultured Massilia sp.]